MRPVLVFGANGQIGWELSRALDSLGVEVRAANRDVAEFTRPDSIRRAIRGMNPGLVINAAAYTQVDQAESKPELATAVNATAPAVIAEEAMRAGIGLVHYSTDYIFDGAKDGAYVEDDEPNPLNVYGRSKLEGERAIRSANPLHLILRTSWVYAARGNNFLRTILRMMRERDELRIVDDQIGAPTWARSIAQLTTRLLRQAISESNGRLIELNSLCGTYHVSAAGRTSWCGFARAIVDEFAAAATARAIRLVPITSADYKQPASRPANSCLSSEKLKRVTGLHLPDWRHDLKLCAAEIEAAQRKNRPSVRGPGGD